MATVSRIMPSMEEKPPAQEFALLLCGQRPEGIYSREKLVVGPRQADGGNIAPGDWFAATRHRTVVVYELNSVFTSWLRVYQVNPITGDFAEPIGMAVAELGPRLAPVQRGHKHAMGPSTQPLCHAPQLPLGSVAGNPVGVGCPRCMHLLKMREFMPC